MALIGYYGHGRRSLRPPRPMGRHSLLAAASSLAGTDANYASLFPERRSESLLDYRRTESE